MSRLSRWNYFDRLKSRKAERVESAQVSQGGATYPNVQSIPPFRFAPVWLDCNLFGLQQGITIVRHYKKYGHPHPVAHAGRDSVLYTLGATKRYLHNQYI